MQSYYAITRPAMQKISGDLLETIERLQQSVLEISKVAEIALREATPVIREINETFSPLISGGDRQPDPESFDYPDWI